MPFKKTAQTYSASINTVTLGTGDKAVTVGGNNVDALCSFDAPIKHKPLIGFEITDKGIDTTLPKLAAEFAGCDTVAAQAAHAAQIPGVDLLCASKDARTLIKTPRSSKRFLLLWRVATSCCFPLVRRTTRPSPLPPAWPTTRNSVLNLQLTSTLRNSSTF